MGSPNGQEIDKRGEKSDQGSITLFKGMPTMTRRPLAMSAFQLSLPATSVVVLGSLNGVTL